MSQALKRPRLLTFATRAKLVSPIVRTKTEQEMISSVISSEH